MTNALIHAENLSKTYGEGEVKTRAVCGVSFSIEKGEFVAIMGPSGSGKSTLMQMLGFLDRPSGGEYYFDGKNSKDFSEEELADIRNKEIGFVFQTFNLLPRTTVFENVELPLLYNRKLETKKENKRIIEGALKAAMIDHRINYLSNQLSGGEKQRVAIARALVNNPEIIFADEPTGNLDSKSGLGVMKILQKLNNEGHTVVLVTHETYTSEHAKRILHMKDGKIISDSPVANRKIAHDGELLK
ncbi:lipoprotein-releasing system ATP-binding protein LolD [bacterium BMS3Abin15]|nr:lipoprotein-releasing system ATP-binding protein LolD [bacterium BMS3Abin15]HDH07761.1 ABC transporter ATP-binding protein [Candidatus Moranbacteria bacterium]HDZ85234.1 ABC transporter ATP-binding protein [Candidatus Moranbacteria bacterium]